MSTVLLYIASASPGVFFSWSLVLCGTLRCLFVLSSDFLSRELRGTEPFLDGTKESYWLLKVR